MIAGIFIRNYKCYKNITFIPFYHGDGGELNVFVGSNGAGKSSILESLDVVLNGVDPRSWPTTQGQKKDRTGISPVFLVDKEKYSFDEKEQAVSDVFWNCDFSEIDALESTESFVLWRNRLREMGLNEKYFLFSIGKNYEGKPFLTTNLTLNNKILNQTRRSGVSKDSIAILQQKVFGLYSYVYIPVEEKVGDVLSHQAKELQSLMDKSIFDEIKKLLDSKEFDVLESKKKKSIVDLVNHKLDSYMDKVNHDLPEGYKFEPKGTNKKTVKSTDIVKVVLEVYFNVRPLTKGDKHISNLSSGEQRMALIDVATTLLATENEKNAEVVLAIDEPESSLEASNQFEQFSRLVEVSEKFRRQIFLTTHWYGLLLKPSKGQLHYVDGNQSPPKIKNFPLYNIHEHRREFPDSVEMKSYFDLMGSMLSLLKVEGNSWLLCEGYEDAKYLNLYMRERVPGLVVLPFNGCGNLKRLYEFLSVPLSDEKESKQVKGKVLFLVDTDEKSLLTVDGYSAGKYNGKMRFVRLSYDKRSDTSSLISVADRNATNTVIEDVLEMNVFWDALLRVCEYNEELNSLISFYDKEDVMYSGVTQSLNGFKKPTIDAYENIDKMQDLLTSREVKKNICDEYCNVYNSADANQLPWIDEIVDFFND
ncbi:ATP-binding protein [Vreelandella aquamarina]|uniref:ATP-dependent nuclease n=1 Tax=Vreelandella aquamarina TaxID=77097 RepID=UPI00384CD67A